jgi:hypothetical protein
METLLRPFFVFIIDVRFVDAPEILVLGAGVAAELVSGLVGGPIGGVEQTWFVGSAGSIFFWSCAWVTLAIAVLLGFAHLRIFQLYALDLQMNQIYI